MNELNHDGSTSEVGWTVTGRLKPAHTNDRLVRARLSLRAEPRPASVPDTNWEPIMRSLIGAALHGGEQ